MTAMTISVRRGSLTLAACDMELKVIAKRLPHAGADERDELLENADRWLETRLELAEERKRIKLAESASLS